MKMWCTKQGRYLFLKAVAERNAGFLHLALGNNGVVWLPMHQQDHFEFVVERCDAAAILWYLEQGLAHVNELTRREYDYQRASALQCVLLEMSRSTARKDLRSVLRFLLQNGAAETVRVTGLFDHRPISIALKKPFYGSRNSRYAITILLMARTPTQYLHRDETLSLAPWVRRLNACRRSLCTALGILTSRRPRDLHKDVVALLCCAMGNVLWRRRYHKSWSK